jgi:hypothetical protein
MAEEPKTETKKKGMPTIAIVGIGCLGVLVLLGIAASVAGKLLFSKFGANLIKQGIEQKTGVSVNTETGGMTFKDKESGAEINVGEAKIPADFPKDMPIYPGAKPAGTISGNDKTKGKGYWLILTTADDMTKVDAYYAKNLPANGWTVDQTMDLGGVSTKKATKGQLVATVTVSADKDKKETSIMLTVTPTDETPTPKAAVSSPAPTEEAAPTDSVGNE